MTNFTPDKTPVRGILPGLEPRSLNKPSRWQDWRQISAAGFPELEIPLINKFTTFSLTQMLINSDYCLNV